ncbi:beta-galactosidase [Pinirhizobacter sp.]|uniref:beta-galactosidase n=1 Tax=Pinirhizobacter sp. TaxID=2950432 RepID=UPI002F411C2F
MAATLAGGPRLHAEDQARVAAPSAHTVTYDRYSLLVDGKRIYLWSGSFHYWRLPSPSLWKDVLQKMKAGGYNGVEIYFHWGFHSPRPGVYDFSGIRDVDRLLDMARDEGIYVIARPGPYINAETDGGGFPAWLAGTAGKPRTTAPEYTAAYKDWLTHIDAIIARHQVTNGTGTVLLYQVENELYAENDDTRRYMQDIADKARADGITVPLTGNHNDNFLTGLGAPQIPGFDSYPLDFDCTRPERWNKLYDFSSERLALKDTPLFFPEYQGGAFDKWGGAGNAKCRELTGVPFERVFYKANIAAGSTMQNFYMTYGGLNWGYLASPGVYTSYDYGAAIEASRKLTGKYDQQKRLGYFVQAVAPLAKTDRLPVRPPTQQGIRDDARINPDDGTQFHIVRHADAASTADDSTHVWMNLAADVVHGGKAVYTSVPQQAGTALRINGRDSKILLAHYHFGSQELVYSTSEWMTQLSSGGRDIALLHGRNGEDGETVLRYRAAPRVRVLAGQVASHFDARAGTLRLNYRHDGLARVSISGTDGTSLLLLLADDTTAATFWQLPSNVGPVLVRGPYLVRDVSVSAADATAALEGDAAQAGEVELFNPRAVKSLGWNGRAVATSVTPSGSLLARVDGPQPVTLPTLDHWKTQAGSPEAEARFDDHAWALADLSSTKNPYWDGHSPIWNSDDYGFHHGAVWYRGHFKATGHETGILLGAYMGVHLGNHGVFTAWLNGHYLGSNPSSSQLFNIDPSWLQPGKDNVLAVLVDNMGHNQEESNGVTKEPHGLYKATFLGSDAAIHWRIQGNLGGEDGLDTVRGPFNNGGLYGERMGWPLPGFDDKTWKDATLPSTATEASVQWYRTNVTLDLPPGQDIPIALEIEDASERPYRALIFVNGWQVGRYISDVGPQHEFELPAGLLHAHGPNTIAIASWTTGVGGGLGKVSLIVQGNVTTSLKIEDVAAPGYQDLEGKIKAAASGR